jgi:hypothetical protein
VEDVEKQQRVKEMKEWLVEARRLAQEKGGEWADLVEEIAGSITEDDIVTKLEENKVDE